MEDAAEIQSDPKPVKTKFGMTTKQRQDQAKPSFYTVFDYDLIQCSKAKTPCEFDLGSQRIKGYPVSVDRYMVKVNVGTEESPILRWIGKHHIVVCTAEQPN